MARAQASIGTTRYAVSIKAGHHAIVADEGAKLGGQDLGPAPYELLLSALGACTAITLKMYAERKAWDLQQAHVALLYRREDDKGIIERTLTFEGGLDDAQKARLADIAERTPVTLTLKSGNTINTKLG